MVWTSQCRVKVNFQVTCMLDVHIWQVNVGSSQVLGNVHPLVVFKWSFNHVQLQRHKPKKKFMVVPIAVTLPWIWTYILHTSECLLYITIVLLAMYSTERALLFATNALVLKKSIDGWSLQIGFFLVLCFFLFSFSFGGGGLFCYSFFYCFCFVLFCSFGFGFYMERSLFYISLKPNSHSMSDIKIKKQISTRYKANWHADSEVISVRI